MNWYNEVDRKALEARGIDYDLVSCLKYNPQDFSLLDIERVLAVWEGENDGEDWRWVLRLHDGRFVFLQGGCDYTGWDCQSWASHVITDSAESAAQKALGEVPVSEKTHPANAGMGHILNILSGEYNNRNEEVYAALMNQLRDGKDTTWRERMDNEMLDGGV